MVVIERIVIMHVHGPKQIVLKPMGMTVIGDHLGMVMERFGDARNMGQAGQGRPAHERQTQKCRQNPTPDCLPCPCHESLPETLAARVRCRLVLSSPGG